MPCDISHSDIDYNQRYHTLEMIGEKVFHDSIHQPTLGELLRLQAPRSTVQDGELDSMADSPG